MSVQPSLAKAPQSADEAAILPCIDSCWSTGTRAAFHGRPELSQALTDELRQLL